MMSRGSVGTAGNQKIYNGLVTAKTRIFEERYSGGVLDMNIFCFTLVYESDEKSSNAPTPDGSITSKKLDSSNQKHVQISNHVRNDNNLDFDEGEELMDR